MKKITLIICGMALLAVLSCKNNKNEWDASGSFEAEETIISSEANGVILQFNVEEGQELQQGQFVGYIDSTQLHLKKLQLQSQASAVLSRKPEIPAQLGALESQLAAAQTEQQRVYNLYRADAATGKQLDDVNAQVAVLKRQIEALRSSLKISSESINQESNPLRVQMAQIEDQLAKCRIVNPVHGTVLSKYAQVNEMAVVGKPLYKIADLSTMILRAYISGNQLPQVKLNQNVTVLTDDGKGGFNEAKGMLEYISDKAEFTPKTIQTKDERANLVYAVKVKVPNDGRYKIGMYGAVKF